MINIVYWSQFIEYAFKLDCMIDFRQWECEDYSNYQKYKEAMTVGSWTRESELN